MNKIKKCLVCGDTASGFNYEALSCESCKVFFCRHSSRLENFKCDQAGECKISISTRNKCPKCRLIKCFASGMKKKTVRQNVAQPVQSSEQPKTGAKLMLELSILKYITEYDNKQISNYLINNGPPKRVPIELSQYELECLDSARSVFRHEPSLVVTKHATSGQDYFDSLLLNSMVYLKKSIRFCHNFGAFNSLSSADQLAVLKPFSARLTPIWAIFNLKMKQDGILVVTNEPETEAVYIPNEILFGCCAGNEAIEKSYKYFIRLNKFMENDVNIRDLATTLMLFRTPQNVTSQENIKYQHYLYSLLLQRYLQSKHHSRKQGNRKYVTLIRLLEQLDSFVEEPKRVFTNEIGLANLPEVVCELNDMV